MIEKPLKILILDNTREAPSFGSKNLVHWVLKVAPQGTEVLVRRPPDQDLPRLDWKFDGMIISGSVTSCLEANEPWIAPYDDFVSEHIKRSTPILGVCYGHQTLARCLFKINHKPALLRKATDAEHGWTEIKVIQASRLFEGLSAAFMTYESHYEEVSELPPGALCLAQTPRCDIQAFEVSGKPVYGIQFHPEYSIEEAEKSLLEKVKKGVRKDWILNQGKGHQLYDEQVGKVIFGNFIRIAAEKSIR